MEDRMGDVAFLILRTAVGGLLAGHGAQKLFGWFGGSGLKGTAAWLESIGIKPGDKWAPVAGLSEFGGGLLTTLGFLNPLGPIAILAAMSMATVKAHRGKPIWATAGGPELAVTNMTVALAIALAGPGRYSLDAAMRLRIPASLVAAAAVAAAAGLATGASSPHMLRDRDAGKEVA
jgi:putative oxidoreductase